MAVQAAFLGDAKLVRDVEGSVHLTWYILCRDVLIAPISDRSTVPEGDTLRSALEGLHSAASWGHYYHQWYVSVFEKTIVHRVVRKSCRYNL